MGSPESSTEKFVYLYPDLYVWCPEFQGGNPNDTSKEEWKWQNKELEKAIKTQDRQWDPKVPSKDKRIEIIKIMWKLHYYASFAVLIW